MTERDTVYLQILNYGLLAIRNAAFSGKIRHCEVEADHLHKLPSLIGESNEHRHRYYFQSEMPLYLERVDHSVPQIKFTLARYSELWDQLATFQNETKGTS